MLMLRWGWIAAKLRQLIEITKTAAKMIAVIRFFIVYSFLRPGSVTGRNTLFHYYNTAKTYLSSNIGSSPWKKIGAGILYSLPFCSIIR